MIDDEDGYTPTPVDLARHPRRTTAAGRPASPTASSITPSHNPPEDGGFKYNPPHGGPADTDVTRWIEDARQRAARRAASSGVPRVPYERARRAPTTHRHDYIDAYVERPRQRSSTWRPFARAGLAHRRRSAGRRQRRLLGAASPSATALDIEVVNDDGRSDLPLHAARLGRQDPHGLLVAVRDGQADRAQGPLRRRLRQRHRRRPPRHRHAQRGPDEPEPLPGGGDRVPVRAPPRLARATPPSARRW